MNYLFLDLDNTLVGTEDLVLPVFLRILKDDYNLCLSEDDFYRFFLGKAGRDLYRAISTHFGGIKLNENSLLEKQQAQNHAAILNKGFSSAPHLIETLEGLSTKGWQMSIVSNSSPEKISLTLENMRDDSEGRLKFLCNGRLISCHLRQKPDPFGYLESLRRALPKEGEVAVCVEDSVTGAQAGIAASLPVFGFTGFARNRSEAQEKLRSAGCVDVFDDWKDFPEVLKRHGFLSV